MKVLSLPDEKNSVFFKKINKKVQINEKILKIIIFLIAIYIYFHID